LSPSALAALRDALYTWSFKLQVGYTEKKVKDFTIPSRRMSLTKLSLDWNNLIMPVQGEFWLATSRLGTGKWQTFFAG
jgi:hypothetical protein